MRFRPFCLQITMSLCDDRRTQSGHKNRESATLGNADHNFVDLTTSMQLATTLASKHCAQTKIQKQFTFPQIPSVVSETNMSTVVRHVVVPGLPVVQGAFCHASIANGTVWISGLQSIPLHLGSRPLVPIPMDFNMKQGPLPHFRIK